MDGKGEKRLPHPFKLSEIFSSILSGRAGVSIMPNGVIMNINLRQELICRAYCGTFISYHHTVMNLLITMASIVIWG